MASWAPTSSGRPTTLSAGRPRAVRQSSSWWWSWTWSSRWWTLARPPRGGRRRGLPRVRGGSRRARWRRRTPPPPSVAASSCLPDLDVDRRGEPGLARLAFLRVAVHPCRGLVHPGGERRLLVRMGVVAPSLERQGELIALARSHDHRIDDGWTRPARFPTHPVPVAVEPVVMAVTSIGADRHVLRGVVHHRERAGEGVSCSDRGALQVQREPHPGPGRYRRATVAGRLGLHPGGRRRGVVVG